MYCIHQLQLPWMKSTSIENHIERDDSEVYSIENKVLNSLHTFYDSLPKQSAGLVQFTVSRPKPSGHLPVRSSASRHDLLLVWFPYPVRHLAEQRVNGDQGVQVPSKHQEIGRWKGNVLSDWNGSSQGLWFPEMEGDLQWGIAININPHLCGVYIYGFLFMGIAHSSPNGSA